jgi:hypothetical protein
MMIAVFEARIAASGWTAAAGRESGGPRIDAAPRKAK